METSSPGQESPVGRRRSRWVGSSLRPAQDPPEKQRFDWVLDYSIEEILVNRVYGPSWARLIQEFGHLVLAICLSNDHSESSRAGSQRSDRRRFFLARAAPLVRHAHLERPIQGLSSAAMR